MEKSRIFMRRLILSLQRRGYGNDPCGRDDARKGLVLAAYDGCNAGELKLSPTATKFDQEMGGKLTELIKGSGIQLGKARVFNNLGNEFYGVAVTGAGPEGLGLNESENINECKENIRIAAATGARALQDMGVVIIFIEGFTSTEPVAEGGALGIWKFEDFKNKLSQTTHSKVELYEDPDRENWEKGIFKAESQNIARRLSDIPANIMTPTVFAQKAIEILCPCGVQVEVRDREWLEQKKMSGFLGVARGTCEPPLFLEMAYCGGNQEDKPVVLIGKGITFDSGGICLHKCKGMAELRADMAGAAVIVGTLKALAVLGSPININAVVPLCENMPGGMAIKPGDIVYGMSGRTLRLEDTSKESRVIMTDALTYSASFKPCLVTTIGTMSDGVRYCLGSSATGTFTTSDVVWRELAKAGAETGDRVWRLPLWKFFADRITCHSSVDINNVNIGNGGDGCSAAAMLMEFVPPVDFLHLDITGTGMLTSGFKLPYYRSNTMTGRPTRTLIQFLHAMACPKDTSAPC